MEGGAERGGAGDVVVGGGGVVAGAVDPGEGGAQVEEEGCGLGRGFEGDCEGVLTGGVVFGYGGQKSCIIRWS